MKCNTDANMHNLSDLHLLFQDDYAKYNIPAAPENFFWIKNTLSLKSQIWNTNITDCLLLVISAYGLPFQLTIELYTRSSATAKSTARPSCLVGVLHVISWEKIRW